jgi:predicted PurR-regulated permease PerM
MAALLAIALSPLQSWLIKKGLPGWAALILTLIVGILILVGLILVLVGGLAQFANALPGYSEQIDALTADATAALDTYDIDLEGILAGVEVSTAKIVEVSVDFVSGLLGALTDVGLVIVIIAFMLVEILDLPGKIEVVRSRMGDALMGRYSRSIGHMRQYLVITAAVGAGAGVLDAIFLGVIGVPFPVLWGVLSFLLSFIPSVGFILALIPPTILALLELGWPWALVVIVGYILINGLFDNVIKPKYMGEGLNLSTMLVFISLIFWGFILGPLGAILAIPLTVLVKELLVEADDQWSWVGILMGTSEGAEAEAKELGLTETGE